jgi:hypothetical protein
MNYEVSALSYPVQAAARTSASFRLSWVALASLRVRKPYCICKQEAAEDSAMGCFAQQDHELQFDG